MLYFIVILLVFVIGLLCGSESETYKREDVIKKYDSLKELYKVLLDDNENIKNENDRLKKKNDQLKDEIKYRPTITETRKNVLEYEAHRLIDFRELNILKDAVPDVTKTIKHDLLREILLKMEQDVSIEEEERCDLHGNTYSMKVRVVK